MLLATWGGGHWALVGLPGRAEQGRRLQGGSVERSRHRRCAGWRAAGIGQPGLEAGHLS